MNQLGVDQVTYTTFRIKPGPLGGWEVVQRGQFVNTVLCTRDTVYQAMAEAKRLWEFLNKHRSAE